MTIVGQSYRLRKATTMVPRGVTRQVCQVLPEGSIVVVEGSGDGGATVNVRCGSQELWMFRVDLDERGNLEDWVPEARKLPLLLHAGAKER